MKALLQKITTSNAGYSALSLRVPIGIIFMAHGAQKLFGWFGGYGLEGTGQWMASIGLSWRTHGVTCGQRRVLWRLVHFTWSANSTSSGCFGVHDGGSDILCPL